MARLHLQYERAFEAYLRSRRIAYVAVNEARKALVPEATSPTNGALKSFDFVVYAQPRNFLIDIKGRRLPAVSRPTAGLPLLAGTPLHPARPRGSRRLESWATREDIASLEQWERLFGPGFSAVLLFIYQSDAPPPDGRFQEVFQFESAWYALRAVEVRDYRRVMKTRSDRWGTVDLPTRDYDALAGAFRPAWLAGTPPVSPRPASGVPGSLAVSSL